MPAIQVRHLSKKYQIYRRPGDKLLELLRPGRNQLHQEFWALEDVSFNVEPGETLGIIGQNGSGKSTLLQILAGSMRQTRGDCLVRGKVSALLELGCGFNPEFTGRENVFMNGAILGFDTPAMEQRFDAIARFAEIGDFMDQPVKTYSSGMFMRLAFSVAIHVDPDILLAGTAHDPHVTSLDGIYRSADGGVTWTLVHQFPGNVRNVPKIVRAPDAATG